MDKNNEKETILKTVRIIYKYELPKQSKTISSQTFLKVKQNDETSL